jgi:glycosyltransferase involved in cell wall biosynthesis
MKLINLSNQIGAGPSNISRIFIKEIAKRNLNVFFVLTPEIAEWTKKQPFQIKFISTGPIHYTGGLCRLLLVNFFLIPFLLVTKPITSLLCFGNFLLIPTKVKTVVLMHHPYLVDDVLFKPLRGLRKLSETIKRIFFRISLSNIDILVVQSFYMKNLFKKKYDNYNGEVKVHQNPISPVFKDCVKTPPCIKRKNQISTKIILYPSRYYPHKNHFFMLEVARNIKRSKRHKDIQFVVTLDSSLSLVQNFLEIVKNENLPIKNIGEISQSMLFQEYIKADIFFFPSMSETFGNPIIEAINFGIPLVLPDLPYARSLGHDAANYFDINSPSNAVSIIKSLFDNNDLYIRSANESFKLRHQTMDSQIWTDNFLKWS